MLQIYHPFCKFVAGMKSLLKAKKLRVTDFRLSVLEVFQAHANAISMEQIEESLVEFDRITLYRTLKSFKEKGLIHEIILPNNTRRLALCSETCEEDDHHHEHVHFQCEECNEIYCVDIPNFPNLGLKGFSVHRLEIQAFGRCSNC